MMEDKQQELMDRGHSEAQAVGTVIAEFGDPQEVAPALGIDQEMRGTPGAVGTSSHALPVLTVERARTYAETVRRSQPLSMIAIPMFVLSPVPMIALLGITGGSATQLPQDWAVAVGLVVLLALVALGVLLLVLRGSRLTDVRDIEEGRFTGSAAVCAFAEDLDRDHSRHTTVSTAISTAMWILSAVPVLLTSILSDDASSWPLFGVCGTLLIIATGLATHIRTSWVENVTSTLQQENDIMPEESGSPVVRVIATAYWPVVTAIFLGWSFLSGDWDSTWVIWPVAGVLYGALWAVASALPGPEKETPQR